MSWKNWKTKTRNSSLNSFIKECHVMQMHAPNNDKIETVLINIFIKEGFNVTDKDKKLVKKMASRFNHNFRGILNLVQFKLQSRGFDKSLEIKDFLKSLTPNKVVDEEDEEKFDTNGHDVFTLGKYVIKNPVQYQVQLKSFLGCVEEIPELPNTLAYSYLFNIVNAVETSGLKHRNAKEASKNMLEVLDDYSEFASQISDGEFMMNYAEFSEMKRIEEVVVINSEEMYLAVLLGGMNKSLSSESKFSKFHASKTLKKSKESEDKNDKTKYLYKKDMSFTEGNFKSIILEKKIYCEEVENLLEKTLPNSWDQEGSTYSFQGVSVIDKFQYYDLLYSICQSKSKIKKEWKELLQSYHLNSNLIVDKKIFHF